MNPLDSRFREWRFLFVEMKKCVFLIVLFFIGLNFVLASDFEGGVGFVGDGEMRVAAVGDGELGSLGGDFIAPEVSVNSPSAGVSYGSANVFLNVTTNEVSVCSYSLDSGVTNFSMTAGELSMDFIAVKSLSNRGYNVRFYCFDEALNLNASMNVSFRVSGPAEGEAASGGGGGGGGASASVMPSKKVELDVDSGSLRVRSVIGDKKNREFSLRNEGDEEVEVLFSIEGEDIEGPDGEMIPFSEFVVLREGSVSLKGGEDVSIEFDVIAPDSLGVFVGYIIMMIDGVRSEIPVSINTQSKETIFDVSTTILDSTIENNEDVRVQIDLLPIGERGIDITLRYNTRDFKGKIYSESSETFYVGGPMSFVKEFSTEQLSNGDYVLATEMIYLGGFASASSQFEVLDESILGIFRMNVATIFFVGVVLVMVLIVAVVLGRLKRIRKYKK